MTSPDDDRSGPADSPAQQRPAPPDPAVRRLSLYLRELEGLHRRGCTTISSRELGEALSLTDAQIRKDFAYFGQFGHPGVGYRVDDLIGNLRHILGTDRTWNVILIGAGNLGRALASYHGFDAKGFRLVGVFDLDPRKVGLQAGELVVQSTDLLPRAITEHKVRLAIIAVPAEAAQMVVDQVVQLGLRGILNFAPVTVSVPPGVSLNSVDLAVQLEQLVFQVHLPDPK